MARAKELEAFRTMSAFFVHDLKNAAASLNLMLKNLPVHFDDPAYREDALGAVGRTAQRIDEMIARLGALPAAGELEPVEVELQPTGRTRRSTRWRNCGALTWRGSWHRCPSILADAEQIRSVVTNLLLNARDALGPGGRIRVRTEPEDGRVVLTVADNGCGMSREFLRDSLFRPFQTTKKKGLGIGMYQARMIVHAHGGSIHVASEAGNGTTVRVSFPIESPLMTKPRLLIVDDDEDIRVQLKWALADEYEVLMAADRTGAVSAFTGERPLVTLLDLGLPPSPNDPEEGLAALSGLLVLDRLAKVIVVSGQGEKQNALRAVGTGRLRLPVQAGGPGRAETRAAARGLRGRSRARVPGRPGRCARRRFRGHAGIERADAGRVRVRPQSRRHERAGARPGRERNGKGDGRARAPPPEPAARRAVCAHQLQRDPGEPARERAVRPREEALSPARTRSARGSSKRRPAARSSSTRSASCRRRCR